MDNLILNGVASGDRDAYAALYLEYFNKFYNYGKKFTTDNPLIEDAIQEVFLDIWSRKAKLVKIETPGGYFFSSFRYILFKKIKQSRRVILNDGFEVEPEFSDHAIFYKEADQERRQKLDVALKSLTAHQREAIYLRFYEGLSYKEVAAVLNLTVRATYKIVARSLSDLKKALQLSLAALLLLFKL